MQKIEVKVFENRILHFNPKPTNGLEFEEEPEEQNSVNFRSNFDYGQLPGNSFFIYIDIGMGVHSYADILTRTGFTFTVNGPTWSDLFVIDFISPMVNIAIINCFKEFRRQCILHKIELPPNLETNVKTGQIITSHIVELYHTKLKQNDIADKELIELDGITLNSDEATLTMVKCAFQVLEEVLFYHKNFNHKQNQLEFYRYVPESRFYTIKDSCLNIGSTGLTLTLQDTLFFLQILDCAIQLLLGDRADELISALEHVGIDKLQQGIFFKKTTQLFKDFSEKLKTEYSPIKEIEIEYNWNTLLR